MTSRAPDGGAGTGAGGAGGARGANGAGGGGAGAGALPVSPSGRAATPQASRPAPPPIVNAEGVPSLGPVADAINSVVAPFQQGPDTTGKNTAEAALLWTAHVVKAETGVLGAAAGIIDGGVASLGHAIGELTGISYPAMPAVTILALHLGPPHAHPHPPSFGVPLPSLGQVIGPGSITVLLGGLPAARCGDFGLAPTCGGYAPPFDIVTGSSSVFIGGKRAARMGDLTRHCNPINPPVPGAKPPSLFQRAGGAMGMVGLAGGAAGAALDQPWALAQAAADLAADVAKSFIGKDPGVAPLFGALVGPPLGNVSIGGFPCPAVGDVAGAAINKGIAKGLKALGGKIKGAAGKLRTGKKGKSTPEAQQQKKCSGGEPIYLVTGEVYTEQVDHAPGILFEWRWRYTSARCGEDGPLGHGVRHCYERRLERRLHRASFHDWNGLTIDFGRFELGQDTTRAQGYVLRRLGRGHFRLSTRGQPDLEFAGGEFESVLPLTRVSNDEAALDLEYDALGRLVALVQTPRESAEPRSRYELALDATGHISAVIEVDARATNGAPRRDPSRDSLRASFEYSTAGDLVRARNSLGGSWAAEYDALHRLSRQTDARGYSYEYRYDASDRCVASSGQDGLWRCKIEYHPEASFTRYTEGDGATWEYHYDDSGVVTKIVDPYGGEERRTLDEQGRVVSEVDSAGRELRWLYDENGAHYARVDRFGNLLLPEEEQPLRPNPFARELPRRPLGFLLASSVEPAPIAMLGVEGSFIDLLPSDARAAARQTFRLRPPEATVAANGAAPGRPRVERDALGRKVREEDARGRVRSWQYDATGNLIAETDCEGHTTRQDIISWNLVGRRRDAAGSGVSYEYSSLEKITAITDPGGNRSEYDWDQKERLARVRRHGRVREEYVYDVGDHFIEKRDGAGNTLFENSVHPSHFVHERKLSSGGLHRYDYDAQGRITEASTESHEVRLAYDAAGERRLDLRDGQGIEHSLLGGRQRASTVFGRYRLLEEPLPLGARLTDAAGRATDLDTHRPGLVERKCANGTLEVLQFDEDGRLEASLRHRPRRAGHQRVWTVRYEYSPEGDLVRVVDSERGTTQYHVDAGHRLRGEVTPRGERLDYSLDTAGNLLNRPGLGAFIIASGNLLSCSAAEDFQYDARNHLGLRTHRATGRRVSYEYDSYDMLVRIRYERPELSILHDISAVPAFEPDSPQQRHPERTPHCLDWHAHYDALGRRLWTEWTTPDGDPRRREFYWDGDRLAAELLPSGRLRVYQYGSSGALSPLQFTEYERVDAPPEAGKTYHVFHDASGQALSIEDDDGLDVWRLDRLDPYGLHELRPRQAIEYLKPGAALEYNLRWPGHYLDPETGLHYNRYRYYDPRLGRYIQSDPIGYEGSPVNLYAYCANPLVQVDVLGLDHDNSTSKSDSSEPDPTNGKREGTKPPRLPGVSASTRVLAAKAGDSKAQQRARQKVVVSFLGEHGRQWDRNLGQYRKPTPSEIGEQLKGHDFRKPVRVGPPPSAPSPQYQRQAQGGHQGQYYSEKDAEPTEVGIAGVTRDNKGRYQSKEQTAYEVDPSAPYLESTAAPCEDTWSVEGQAVPTRGGATQRVIGERSFAKPI